MRFWNVKLQNKLKESVFAVLPVAAIVLILSFTIAPLTPSILLSFLLGALLVIVGMMFFTLGAEMSMTPMGEKVGARMTKSKKLWVIVMLSFVLGVIITISEPDLQVLAQQVPSVPNAVLIYAVALGVGLFLVCALLRMLFGIALNRMLIIFYIMALGVGISAIRSDRHAANDSFGLVALCSIGPILAVLVLGMIYHPDQADLGMLIIPEVHDSIELWGLFSDGLPHYMQEIAVSLLPIVAFFGLFQVFSLKLTGRHLGKIIIGLIYTYAGLVLFLTGANVGFMPAGSYLGEVMAAGHFGYLLVPIGALIGFFIVKAEPAVYVLNHQVEEITDGAISARAMGMSLSLGVSASVALAMIRVLTGIPVLYFLIPGYVLAIGLSFFTPKIFTAIAFDSGGVASGPMTATFLLPLAQGACQAVGGNVVADAFGVVAMVAMTPLITIQVLGLVHKLQLRKPSAMEYSLAGFDEDAIIEL